MRIVVAAVVLVALARCVELFHANANTRRLLARGGIECGRSHYPLFIALHASWLASVALFAGSHPPVHLWLLGAFAALQAGRLWVIASLGEYWTTRIVTLPGAPLVRRGPYRLMRHPNYAIVAAEIAVLPLAFGEFWVALAFTLANAALLALRIRVEQAALAGRS